MSSLLKALTFGKTKHEKLPEEWGEDIKEPVSEGLPFHCKYIGSTLVEKASDDSTTADAIKTIIQMAKMSGKAKSLRKVVLTIKPTGISCKDALNDDEIFDISIYRISYCSADANYDRVVAFIATNVNETHECHAFLTRKDEVARACALTISQAFSIAFEKYKETLEEKNQGKQSAEPSKSPAPTTITNNQRQPNENVQKNRAPMIDFLTDSD
ncbi:low density lipoprotein receptor adapter protein 1-A-like [Panonychus citri]|uniref:low density lipoprotein receptor adapter protein 1-A-like n=1 Tax=Panonychus citri TaxID=50023 RepID=UPI0023070016|nr:low density lipoprotein receptor adapter protein 1-A-like [Panonychus citri]